MGRDDDPGVRHAGRGARAGDAVVVLARDYLNQRGVSCAHSPDVETSAGLPVVDGIHTAYSIAAQNVPSTLHATDTITATISNQGSDLDALVLNAIGSQAPQILSSRRGGAEKPLLEILKGNSA